jgi:hypothetical protein
MLAEAEQSLPPVFAQGLLAICASSPHARKRECYRRERGKNARGRFDAAV